MNDDSSKQQVEQSDGQQPKCELCGEPMPPGEEMFKFHGYSGPCPPHPAPPSNLTGEDRDAVTMAHIAAGLKDKTALALLPVIDRLDAKLSEVTRERDEARETIGRIHGELSMVRNDATDGRNWKILLGNIKSDLAAATEAKERAERRLGEAYKRIDDLRDESLADAYHTIRESLGMDPDTDPQEVADAVGMMRATVEKLPLTADGVRVIPHITETVYHPVHGECWIANGYAASYYPPERPKGPANLVALSQCYSTRQAAADGGSRE